MHSLFQQHGTQSTLSHDSVQKCFSLTLFELFFFLFDLQNISLCVCELVLYSVKNYGFCFNGLREIKKKRWQEEPLSLFLLNHSLCSGLKKKKVVKSLEQESMYLQGLSFPFFVCFSFYPSGEPESVKLHRHKDKKSFCICHVWYFPLFHVLLN